MRGSLAPLLTGGLRFDIESLADASNPTPREIAFAGAAAFLGLPGNAACALKKGASRRKRP